jgi:hypothetical protein
MPVDGFYICPTALPALCADGIALRLLYAFRLGSQTVVGLHFWKPLIPDKRGRLALMMAPAPWEEGRRSGTAQPKTVVVVTIVWIVVIAVHSTHIVVIVVPRATTQRPPLPAREPHSFL